MLPNRASGLVVIWFVALWAVATVSPADCLAQGPDTQSLPEFDHPREVKPGQTGLLTSAKGMGYFLRVPKGFDPKKPPRLIVFLHGSNMNGLQFLRSFEQMKWCEDAILACPNGEKGDDPYGRNNFTFQSASFIAEITKDLQATFRPSRTYVGGFSQGGYVTYSVIMLHPELYQGALPMAGDCWMQNEPNLWETQPGELEKQRKIAIAIVHGKADAVVQFSAAEHSYDVFRAMAYPRLRLFAPEKLGHMFMLSPVPQALEWIEAMVGDDPVARMKAAEKYAQEKEWGWAVRIARDLSGGRSPKKIKKRAKSLLRAAEAAAKKDVKGMAKHMEQSPPETWVPLWLQFRQWYGETDAARKLVRRYDQLRGEQRAQGRKLFQKAVGEGRSGNMVQRDETLRQLLREAPATYEAHYAVKWLANSSADSKAK